MKTHPNYIIISPVKDEERYVEATLRSVTAQTVKPSQWIIVDDGSVDCTPQIIEHYRQQLPWIKVMETNRDAIRRPGRAEIVAFLRAYETIENGEFDFIVKLDCDVQLPPNYFEILLARFADDEKLGIASGVYVERHGKRSAPVPMPHYHAAGASKMIRKECFAQIGKFEVVPGWDTIDEIRGQELGWQTRHFVDLEFLHLKVEGSGIGRLRTSRSNGAIYHSLSAPKVFFLLKIINRIFCTRPFVLAGLAMAWGYLEASVTRRPLIVTKAQGARYRQMLNSRMSDKVRQIFKQPVRVQQTENT